MGKADVMFLCLEQNVLFLPYGKLTALEGMILWVHSSALSYKPSFIEYKLLKGFVLALDE